MSTPSLDETSAGSDPFALFARWFSEAERIETVEPAAMALATATSDGMPSVRIVLLRGHDERGFVFFTNYLSRKGRELAANPRAAMTLYWAELGRQVRIEGTVARVSTAESDAYFRSRPVGSQLGAVASPQSEVMPDRQTLERRMAEVSARYADGEVPRPDHWGGYRVEAHTIEFWQSRENRLHDRIRFTLEKSGTWRRERLAP